MDLYEIRSLLDIKKCNCGRSYCEYFAGGMGDCGQSFTKEELKELKKIIKKADKYLDKLK